MCASTSYLPGIAGGLGRHDRGHASRSRWVDVAVRPVDGISQDHPGSILDARAPKEIAVATPDHMSPKRLAPGVRCLPGREGIDGHRVR